ncbi:MAG: KGG domain-containing protein [Stenotrophomonas sp.]
MANNQNQGNSNRGFASMDEDKQREISAKGGRAAHESGNAHEFSSEEAREAGRKGGEAVSQDRQHMADIGREGGQSRGGSQGGNQGGQQQQQRGGGNRGGQQR